MPFNTPQSFLDYVRYSQFIAQLGFFSTAFFCFILIFLTLFGVKRNFGTYKYLLVLFPIVGIFFATIELNVYSHNAGFVIYSTSRPFNMSQDAVTWFLAIYTGVYATTISMLSVQFLYRYWAIIDEKKLRFFKGWRFMIWIAYSIYFGFQWGFGLHYFGKIDDYAKNYLRLEMMQKYSTDFSEIAGMAIVAYDEDDNIRWFNICSTLNHTFIMLIQYSVIIYCGIWMYIEMEEKLPLLDLECDLPSGIFVCAFTLYPAIDAIIVMYIVADYKKAAKKIMNNSLEQIYACLRTAETDHSNRRTRSTAANLPAALSPN
ncbi:hypothetical protein GCK72_017351 [Caenorhabditis remanei]|uniref:Uncharacterized protein n=1 Tax=Caenorhabditis remanei TaxID=31234 RepID=A0A6A5G700_CAERE|nr:hypothetical protein GCK72_017351 [Caenorhabditis remanei]KAF1750800.1 hypothetical protein GCK72_017351 [Caenorhabditis remanei]